MPNERRRRHSPGLRPSRLDPPHPRPPSSSGPTSSPTSSASSSDSRASLATSPGASPPTTSSWSCSGCSHNTLATILSRGEERGWFRRALVPGRHGLATGRIGIVLFIRPTDRPVATPETFDQVVDQIRAEIRRGPGRTPGHRPSPSPPRFPGNRAARAPGFGDRGPQKLGTGGPQKLGTALLFEGGSYWGRDRNDDDADARRRGAGRHPRTSRVVVVGSRSVGTGGDRTSRRRASRGSRRSRDPRGRSIHAPGRPLPCPARDPCRSPPFRRPLPVCRPSW